MSAEIDQLIQAKDDAEDALNDVYERKAELQQQRTDLDAEYQALLDEEAEATQTFQDAMRDMSEALDQWESEYAHP